ncbi:MAG: hypothetical protein IKT31_02865 [Firmicutes bacterium]|nr:hypothetical protein [Bacillota bacterium]
MNNFETFDNLFQLFSLIMMMIIAAISGLGMKSRKLVVLACGYGSFILGLLFYMLHLAILGDIPRVFYVSEVSWMAGYLFYLFLVTLRKEGETPVFEVLPAVFAVLTAAAAVYNDVMGGSILMSLSFGVVAGCIVYISVSGLLRAKEAGENPAPFDIAMVAVVVLQNMVYFISGYIVDYTRFNLYFAADILLTLSMCSLFWFIRKEVRTK